MHAKLYNMQHINLVAKMSLNYIGNKICHIKEISMYAFQVSLNSMYRLSIMIFFNIAMIATRPYI